MSLELISHSDDLTRLHKEGFAIEVFKGYLIVHHVPYVTSECTIEYGKLVTELALSGDRTAPPKTHVASFAGKTPCTKDGNPLSKIINSPKAQQLTDQLRVDLSFSSKPKTGKYKDYYELVTTYVAIISGHAEAIDPQVTACKFQVVEPSDEEESPFQYIDNASSRAGIYQLTEKLQLNEIKIVGLGGTGAYVLDLISKLPVKRISLYDGDDFLQHNAFRAPGAASIDQLRERLTKVAYLKEQYSRMHKGIQIHPIFIDESNVDQLAGADFVFLCMDSLSDKTPLIKALEEDNVPFIDTGMGLEIGDSGLVGLVRTTTSTESMRSHVHDSKRIPSSGSPQEDVYANNIQIADLNALNAAFAVIRMKKYFQFYEDYENEHYSLYTVDGNEIDNEDKA